MFLGTLFRAFLLLPLLSLLITYPVLAGAPMLFPTSYCEGASQGLGDFSRAVHGRANVFREVLADRLQHAFSLLKFEMDGHVREFALRELAQTFFVYLDLLNFRNQGIAAFVADANRETLDSWGLRFEEVVTPTFRPEVRVILTSAKALIWGQTFLRDLPTMHHLKSFSFRWVLVFQVAEWNGEALNAEVDLDQVSVDEGVLDFHPGALRLALRSASHPDATKDLWPVWSRVLSDSAYLDLAHRDHAAFKFSAFLAALHPETAKLSSSARGEAFFESTAPATTLRRLMAPASDVERELESRLAALLWLKEKKYEFAQLRSSQKQLWTKRRNGEP